MLLWVVRRVEKEYLTEMLVDVQRSSFLPSKSPCQTPAFVPTMRLYHSLQIHSESYSPDIILYNLER